MIHEMIPVTIKGKDTGAKLYTYFWSNSKELYDGRKRPCILICPGGGYEMTSDREAEGVAIRFMEMGYHAAVLRYSTTPDDVFPDAFLEAAACMKMLREHAKEWYIDSKKIVIQGSSAGGHLAAMVSTYWNNKKLAEILETTTEMLRPNGQILSYPVITTGKYRHEGSFKNLLGNFFEDYKGVCSVEENVSQYTPKTFIWHTFEDAAVPVENSLMYVKALVKANIQVEFHLFPYGVHGLGTATPLSLSSDGRGVQKQCAIWMDLAKEWIENL
nr:alpha/beta hydrolase [uncultured Sellimonas sp.]